MIPAFRWLIQGVSGDQSHSHTLTKFKTIWNACGPVSKRGKKKLTWVENRLQFSRNEWVIRPDVPMNLAVLSQGLFSYDSGDLPHATFDRDSFWGPISNVTHFWYFPLEELLLPTRPGVPVCSSSDTTRKLCFRCLPLCTDSPGQTCFLSAQSE